MGGFERDQKQLRCFRASFLNSTQPEYGQELGLNHGVFAHEPDTPCSLSIFEDPKSPSFLVVIFDDTPSNSRLVINLVSILI